MRLIMIIAALVAAPHAQAEPFRPSRLSTASVEIVLDGTPYTCAPQGLEPSASGTARFAPPTDIGGAVAEAGGCGTWGGQCGDRTPAVPVPECVDAATAIAAACSAPGAVRLWSVWLEPVVPATPGGRLPADRDSTHRYQGICVPGSATSTELYRSIAIAGDHLVVAYNAGVSSWRPVAGGGLQRVAVRDGWGGAVWAFPPPSEQLNFIQGVFAGQSSGVVYVAASGVNPVGTTLWELAPTGALEQLFQDATADSRDTRVFELGGNPYAISVAAAGNEAVVFYDLASARSLRDDGTKCCLACPSAILRAADAVTSGCGAGVRLGTLPAGGGLHRYVDVAVVGGKAYVVTANPLSSLRIWEISAPVDPGKASTRFTGPTNVFAPTFIEVGSTVYLAWVKNKILEVYNATSCLDGDGCGALGSPVYTRTLRDAPTAEQFLTVSTGSGGRRFLYYGCNGCPGLAGSAVEQLLDITALGPHGLEGEVWELTQGGGSYPDRCPGGAGQLVDYWGRYYPANLYGLNAVQPHVGVVRGEYFYRAAESILDVHRLRPAPPPAPPAKIFRDGFETGDVAAWSVAIGGGS